MQTFCCRTLPTPIGPVVAFASEAALAALEFESHDRHERLERRRRCWFPPHRIEEGSNAVIDRTARWLDDYFAGRLTVESRLAGASGAGRTWTRQEVPLSMYGTEFEQRVWRRLLEIAAGETTSYGSLAAALGLRNGARAVGLANGANPLAIIVPCHRVIGSTGALTGYGGGLDRKQWLLAHERRWSKSPPLFWNPSSNAAV